MSHFDSWHVTRLCSNACARSLRSDAYIKWVLCFFVGIWFQTVLAVFWLHFMSVLVSVCVTRGAYIRIVVACVCVDCGLTCRCASWWDATTRVTLQLPSLAYECRCHFSFIKHQQKHVRCILKKLKNFWGWCHNGSERFLLWVGSELSYRLSLSSVPFFLRTLLHTCVYDFAYTNFVHAVISG